MTDKQIYIPNPLAPQDDEGKAKYLSDELNKISTWTHSSNLNTEDSVGGIVDPSPTPPETVDPPVDPGNPPNPDNPFWYNCESPNAGLYYRYDDGDSVQWVPVSSGGAGPPGKDGNNPDGGKADSIYLPEQNIDGGNA
jgi:hypothetical protein